MMIFNSNNLNGAFRRSLFYVFLAGLLRLIVGTSKAYSQTYPSPHDLSACNLSFPLFVSGHTSRSSTSTQGWSFSGEPSASTVEPASTNEPLANSSASATSGNIKNETSNGISFLASGSADVGAFVVALNTSSREDITLSWSA